MNPRSLVASCTFLALAGSVLGQSACLDQSHVPSSLTNGLEVTQNQPVTQTFTCGRTGQLLQVEVARIRHHNGISTNPLTVSIVTTDSAGVPTTSVLASVTFPPASVPTAIAPLLVDLAAANVQVQAGQVLGLALTSPNPPSTPSYAWWGEAPGGGYANGLIYIQQTLALSVWDLAFQTWVSVPASQSSYGAGHAGTTGIPNLSSSADPVLGTTPVLQLGNSAGATTAGAIFFGAVQVSIPTPFGGTALLQPLASVGLVVPTTGAQLPFPLPLNSTLCGLSVFMQGVVIDAGASQGIAFSPGLAFVLGD